MQSEPGSPNLNGVPLCVPTLNGNEADYLRECIESGWVSSAGPFVDKLESSLASYVDRKYAVAMASGTAAIHLALKTVGVREGDEVIVSDLTFIAPVNVIRYLSAYPVLVDAEKRHWQMDTRLVETFLREKCERRQNGLFNKATGRRVAAVLPVHILGHPVELNHINGLATEFGSPVVEDATESLGSVYDGELVGKKGVVSCFSFNGNKLMTSGGGGMAVTDNPDYAEKYFNGAPNDTYIEWERSELFKHFISRHMYTRVAQSPCSLVYGGPDCPEGIEELRKVAHAQLDRWLAWVDEATPVATELRAAQAERDLFIRRTITEGDPANIVVENLFGKELSDELVAALWGRDRKLPRPL